MSKEQEQKDPHEELSKVVRSMIQTTIGHADAGVIISKEDEINYIEGIVLGTIATYKEIYKEEEFAHVNDLLLKSFTFFKNNLVNNIWLMIDNINLEDAKEYDSKNDVEKGIIQGKRLMGETIKDYLERQ